MYVDAVVNMLYEVKNISIPIVNFVRLICAAIKKYNTNLLDGYHISACTSKHCPII